MKIIQALLLGAQIANEAVYIYRLTARQDSGARADRSREQNRHPHHLVAGRWTLHNDPRKARERSRVTTACPLVEKLGFVSGELGVPEVGSRNVQSVPGGSQIGVEPFLIRTGYWH
jgi:hypothetical protein